VKDQEGIIPRERQLTKQIIEYTQWESDETREIKGCGPRGPSEAFRRERLQPGSPHTHSCFRAWCSLSNKATSVWENHSEQGRQQKPLIGVESEWPGELQMPPAGWGTLFLSSFLGHQLMASFSNALNGSVGLLASLGPGPCFCFFAVPYWASCGLVFYALNGHSSPSTHFCLGFMTWETVRWMVN
jgi:hypothetical protein